MCVSLSNILSPNPSDTSQVELEHVYETVFNKAAGPCI